LAESKRLSGRVGNADDTSPIDAVRLIRERLRDLPILVAK